jgi:hypothetical protein
MTTTTTQSGVQKDRLETNYACQPEAASRVQRHNTRTVAAAPPAVNCFEIDAHAEQKREHMKPGAGKRKRRHTLTHAHAHAHAHANSHSHTYTQHAL